MPQASWMLTLLANETNRYHAAADGDRLALMSAHAYPSCLEQIYHFEQPVEAALARTPGFDPALLQTHLKTNRLANDLRGLGVTIESVAESAVAFEHAAQALGWLYAIHRNTLYHELLLRQLTLVIPEQIAFAGSYLAAFDGVAGERMRELGSVLDRTARRGAETATEIVAAANEAFGRQRQWYASAASYVEKRAHMDWGGTVAAADCTQTLRTFIATRTM